MPPSHGLYHLTTRPLTPHPEELSSWYSGYRLPFSATSEIFPELPSSFVAYIYMKPFFFFPLFNSFPSPEGTHCGNSAQIQAPGQSGPREAEANMPSPSMSNSLFFSSKVLTDRLHVWPTDTQGQHSQRGARHCAVSTRLGRNQVSLHSMCDQRQDLVCLIKMPQHNCIRTCNHGHPTHSNNYKPRA